MASFPASVQGVSLEDPFIASGLLYILVQLIPSSYMNYDKFQNVWSLYDSYVANPPYFAMTLPGMPIATFYDKFMEPGAMPLQYVRMPPDKYIPKIFTAVDFTSEFQLVDLYKEASQFFGDTASQSNSDPGEDEVGTPVEVGAVEAQDDRCHDFTNCGDCLKNGNETNPCVWTSQGFCSSSCVRKNSGHGVVGDTSTSNIFNRQTMGKTSAPSANNLPELIITCYGPLLTRLNTASSLCGQADEEARRDAICQPQNSCKSCTNTSLSHNASTFGGDTCEWYPIGNFCGRPVAECGLPTGCGTNSCLNITETVTEAVEPYRGLCSATDCLSCVTTTILDENETACVWYDMENVCGAAGDCASMAGCGSSTCDSSVGNTDDPNSAYIKLCSTITGCSPCIDNSPICGWSVEDGVCFYNAVALPDMPGPEICSIETITLMNTTSGAATSGAATSGATKQQLPGTLPSMVVLVWLYLSAAGNISR